MNFIVKLIRSKNSDVLPVKEWPTWLLSIMVILCFPALLWLSQMVPVGLEFMKIVNNTEIVWDFPTITQAFKITCGFLIFGPAALPLFIFSAACSTVLINRTIGENTQDSNDS